MRKDLDTKLICQSCSMLMDEPNDFGTDSQGLRVDDYCHFCFQNGEFTQTNMSMEEMICNRVSIMMDNVVISKSLAERIAKSLISPLKRWK